MRIAVSGCRGYNNYDELKKIMDEFTRAYVIILSGHCKGTDALAEKYAATRGY